MCGRFTLNSSGEELAEVFELGDPVPELDLAARYNIAPTQDVVAVRTGPDGLRALHWLHWGLIPSWAKDGSRG